MAKVTIISERCKGCGLCVEACPRGCLRLGQDINAKGYNYVEFSDDGDKPCTGCAFCAQLCPDVALRVFKQERG
ncbi:4Fe-4S ferredoxin iron-sulfur binding domain protein [Desulfarculus baarsii DSM 2075]|uniref:4Fe-4S ferredoxin iron-sulfur binding domain protein n=1 Tax=Desulfarculus baarsii (strain ATCC 33931 / DSM 2075 / LMG 7858 / VKM B-1802 / 2st14) TaxID=644282 RepID=E1QL54_DESB2|nr:ferredoxin family protein [Desulfarculus baarsii]ADK85319.1 4Fe-4S ferredoxin iron-sulfur binding domain protein [Desulfarculus baarsii DSM 2075]